MTSINILKFCKFKVESEKLPVAFRIPFCSVAERLSMQFDSTPRNCSSTKTLGSKAESPLGGKISRYVKLNQSLLFAARIFRRDRFG